MGVFKWSGEKLSEAWGGLTGEADRRHSRRMTDKTIAANKELAEYEWSQNIAQWNRANEYNTPANQMARYRAAGLNPNLVAGGVGSSVGTATESPKYQRAQADYTGVLPPSHILQTMALYNNLDIQRAAKDKLIKETENIEANRKATLAGILGIGSESKSKALRYNKELATYSSDVAGTVAENLLKEINTSFAKDTYEDRKSIIRADLTGKLRDNDLKFLETNYERWVQGLRNKYGYDAKRGWMDNVIRMSEQSLVDGVAQGIQGGKVTGDKLKELVDRWKKGMQGLVNVLLKFGR